MKFTSFYAQCPFEVGDLITTPDGVSEITDIAFTHYFRSRQVLATYELDNCGLYRELVVVRKEDPKKGN